MPRYFFLVTRGDESELNDEGIDLPDGDAAWIEATIACGELLRDLDGSLKPGDHWSMRVKDDSGADIYFLEFKTQKLL